MNYYPNHNGPCYDITPKIGFLYKKREIEKDVRRGGRDIINFNSQEQKAYMSIKDAMELFCC